MHSTTPSSCPLCSSPVCAFYNKDDVRTYIRCASCGLIFTPPEYHISPEEEIVRYSKHTNYKNNKDYVAYLSGIADVILSLPVQSPTVLDFGCGPEHVLADILNERGVRCAIHDPLYGISAAGSGERYDIIAACEVFEHLRDLRKELELISRLMKPGGYLYVHTQMYDNVKDFPSWWYIKDNTHINFFSQRTMEKVGEIIRRKIFLKDGKDTVVFR